MDGTRKGRRWMIDFLYVVLKVYIYMDRNEKVSDISGIFFLFSEWQQFSHGTVRSKNHASMIFSPRQLHG